MRRGVVALALLTGLSGCGSGGSTLLRDTDAAGLKDTLEQVRKAVDARDVGACTARIRELRTQVGNLPSSVDRRLRVRLREEIVDKLVPRVTDQCDDPKTVTQPTVTTPAPTGPTGPTDGEDTPTTSSTTETTPTPTDTPDTVTTPTPEEPVPSVPTDTAPPTDPGGFGDEGGG